MITGHPGLGSDPLKQIGLGKGSHMVSSKIIELRPDLAYEEEPVEILAREVKELRNKQIPLVKVLWKNHKTEEATWEIEETMDQQYL